MRAVQITAPGAPRLVEAPPPRPGPGEAVVRVEVAALCATDRKLTANGSTFPRIPGHEIAGRLEDGTLVGVHPDIGCGRCPACRSGLENRCAARVSIGLDRDGGLADLVAVPEPHLVPLRGVELGLSPILEPLACCLHAVSIMGARRGDTAVVVGAGAMGILCMWALQQAGATVAVCQRSRGRRELAAELGADAVLGPEERGAAVLGREPALVIVTAHGAPALEWALREVAVGGVVHAFAGAPGGAAVDANLVHYRHLRLVGSTGSTLSDYERALGLVTSGAIALERLPRTTIALEQVPEALVDDPDPHALKIMVDMKGREQ